MRRIALLVVPVLLASGFLALSGRAEEGADERAAVLALIAARRGESIADVGSGKGTWTFDLAAAVGPQGHVHAVDIDADALEALRAEMTRRGVENVTVIHSVPDDPMLPVGQLDAVFLNNVIDWVERPALAGFLAGIRQALKPDGRLVIRDPSGGPDRVIAECYRNGFALVEAKIPLETAPSRSFSTGWYALKLRRSEVQPPVLPRLGRPARYRFRLHLAEELFRTGLVGRDEFRAKWERIRDLPGGFDPATDDARDLVRAARTLDVVSEAEAEAILGRLKATR
jgi:ubiquinone/menaquinone biosynthesis C-methylase UbiE